MNVSIILFDISATQSYLFYPHSHPALLWLSCATQKTTVLNCDIWMGYSRYLFSFGWLSNHVPRSLYAQFSDIKETNEHCLNLGATYFELSLALHISMITSAFLSSDLLIASCLITGHNFREKIICARWQINTDLHLSFLLFSGEDSWKHLQRKFSHLRSSVRIFYCLSWRHFGHSQSFWCLVFLWSDSMTAQILSSVPSVRWIIARPIIRK